MKRRVVITGMGVVSPHGCNMHGMFDALMRGEVAISLHALGEGKLSLARPAAVCADFDPVEALGRPRANQLDRFSQMGLAAALDAWRDAGVDALDDGARERVGVYWGTGSGGNLSVERGYRDLFQRNRLRISPMSVPLAMTNAAASHIAIALRLGGPCLTHSVACASSAVAIGEAMRLVRDGSAPLMVVGGSEALLSLGAVVAWDSLQVLAPGNVATAASACRPFSIDRQGLALGEGAAALVIEDLDHANARGATIYAELVGYGTSCDHSHLTRPQPSGQARAIQACLKDAGVSRDAIGYVNAHGTATTEGDPSEVSALLQVFGDQAASLAVSATKSMHGHLMGAAGAMEALITALAVKRRQIPPTANLVAIDPDCVGVGHVTRSGMSQPNLNVALSNSFAFGGSNAVLAFRGMRDDT